MAAAALFGLRLGVRSLWGSEGRWAEAVRWIYLSGDPLTPRIDGVPYLLKPAPAYWPAALASWGGISEATLRLPSVLAALATVWATIQLGRLWASPRVGLLAGAVLSTTGLFVFWARVSTGDMLTVAAVTLAVLAGERFRRSPRPGWLYLLGLLCGLGSLAKGLLGVVLPALSLAALALGQRGCASPRARRALVLELRRFFGGGHALGALLLLALAFLAPFVAERVALGHWDSLYAAYLHSFGRFLGLLEDKGSEGPLFYLYYLFVLAAPWALWLPLALRRPLRPALAWFLALLLFFTLSSSRRSYYLLPILPASALLIASAWLEGPEGAPAWIARARAIPLRVLVLAGLLGGAGAPLLLPALTRGALPESVPSGWLLGGALLLSSAGFAAALRAERAGRRERSGLLTAATFACGLAFVFWVLLPQSEGDRTLRPFARAVARQAEGVHLGLLRGRVSAPLAFYLDRGQTLDEVSDRQALGAYSGLVLARACELELPVGWRVLLRERPAPPGADPLGPAGCARCSLRGKACKHYLLIGRDP